MGSPPTWWMAAPSQNYLCQGNYPATVSKAPGVTRPLHFSDPCAGKGHPVPISMRLSWESQPASAGTRRGSQVPLGESPKVAWDCLPRFFTRVAGRGQQPNARGVFRPHLNPVTQRPNLAQFQVQGAASCPEAPPSTELPLSHGCGCRYQYGCRQVAAKHRPRAPASTHTPGITNKRALQRQRTQQRLGRR